MITSALAALAGLITGAVVVRSHWRRRLLALMILIGGAAYFALAWILILIIAFVVIWGFHAKEIWLSIKDAVPTDYLVDAWRTLLSGERP